jgi:hypothetical protein
VSRQTHAVPHASVATDRNEPLHIELNFPPQVAFYFMLFLNDIAKAAYLVLGKLFHFGVGVHSGSRQDPPTQCRTNTIDILQAYLNPFIVRKIDSGNPRHKLTLPLFVLRVFANNSDYAFTPHNLTLSATALD